MLFVRGGIREVRRGTANIISIKGDLMKKTVLCGILVLCSLLVGGALWAQNSDKAVPRAKCKFCGMSPDYFTWSRVIIEYEDGTKVATCSFHCACLELVSKFARGVTKIYVGDYQTKELIDAETAFFAIGGDKGGVMAKTATWAFAKKEDAEKYVKEHGGAIGSFGDALNAGYKDISDGIKQRRERDRAKANMTITPQKQTAEMKSEQKTK